MAYLERLRSGLQPDSWRSHLRPTKTASIFLLALLLLPVSGVMPFSALANDTLEEASPSSASVETPTSVFSASNVVSASLAQGLEIKDLIAKAEALDYDRKFDEARSLYNEILRNLGDSRADRLHRAHLLCNLGLSNHDSESQEIDLQYQEAQDIYLELEGRDSAGFARTLSCQAILLSLRGEKKEALPLLEAALKKQAVNPGPKHPHYLETLHIIGHCHTEASTKYGKAIEALEEVLATRQELEVNPKRVAWSHHDLAIAYHHTRNFAKAIDHYSQAAEIRGRYEDPFMVGLWVQSQLTWGACLSMVRNYAEAIIAIEEVLLRLNSYPDAEPGMLLSTYQMLGWVREIAGDDRGAEYCLKQGLALIGTHSEFENGRDHSNILGAMAKLLAGRGKFVEALEYAELHYSLPGAHDVLNSPSQLRAEAEIGLYRVMTGQDVEGLAKIERAFEELSEREDASGSDIAEILDYQGRAYMALGDYPKATQSLLASLNALGGLEAQDANGLSIQKALSELYFAQGDHEEAWKYALAADSDSYVQLLEALQALSEPGAVLFARKFKSSLPVMAHIASRHLDDADRIASVWDVLIRNRSITLDEMSRRREFRREHALAGKGAFASLAYARDVLTRRLRDPNPQLSEEERRQGILDAEREVEWAERTVAKLMREPIRPMDWGVHEIRNILPDDANLISYVRVPGILGGEDWYGAFVMTSGDPTPRFVRLASAEQIDFSSDRLARHLNQSIDALAHDWEESERAYAALGGELRELVWTPVASHLEGDQIFIVPDGALSNVVFHALPTSPGRYLRDEGLSFTLLFSERDLDHSGFDGFGEGMLVVGDVDFNDAPGETDRVQDQLFATRGYDGFGVDLEKIYFHPLDHTRSEAISAAQSWRELSGTRAQSLFGKAAREHKVAEHLPGKRYGHFATHGFVVQSSEGESLRARSLQLQSGLALSGANHGAGAYSEDDGLLLAGEIQLMDLTGMELVVLSACHTGLGRVEAGEGVFGLPRAFRIAGARSLVVSLFAVDDQMTQEWMKTFYFHHFDEKKTVSVAYNETMDEKLSKLRLEGKTTHPFYWAGFVAVGHDADSK